jgi:membrane protein implicated in regulation of membrane protease activity
VPAWAVWVLVAVGLAVGEILTLDFWLGSIALAAALTALVAGVGLGAPVQLGVFIAGSLASVFLLRPIARAHLVRSPPAIRTGTAALVGARAVVVERVDDERGQVRIGGEIWSARAYMDDQVLEPGTRVEVAEIEGATALVYE